MKSLATGVTGITSGDGGDGDDLTVRVYADLALVAVEITHGCLAPVPGPGVHRSSPPHRATRHRFGVQCLLAGRADGVGAAGRRRRLGWVDPLGWCADGRALGRTLIR
jgi:hypothetical protein